MLSTNVFSSGSYVYLKPETYFHMQEKTGFDNISILQLCAACLEKSFRKIEGLRFIAALALIIVQSVKYATLKV